MEIRTVLIFFTIICSVNLLGFAIWSVKNEYELINFEGLVILCSFVSIVSAISAIYVGS